MILYENIFLQICINHFSQKAQLTFSLSSFFFVFFPFSLSLSFSLFLFLSLSFSLQPLMAKPGLWFVINMTMWGLIALLLTKFMAYLTSSTGVICCRYETTFLLMVTLTNKTTIVTVTTTTTNNNNNRYKANIPIKLPALQHYLYTKDIQEEETQQENNSAGMSLKKVSWQEEALPGTIWENINPQVKIFISIYG